jgi:hypothetical protein
MQNVGTDFRQLSKTILYSWDMALQAVSLLVMMFYGVAETWKIMLMGITVRLPSLNPQRVSTAQFLEWKKHQHLVWNQ